MGARCGTEEGVGLMRVLVTGSRTWTDHGRVKRALDNISHTYPGETITLVHGGARGADRITAALAKRLGWQVEAHPAEWHPAGVYNPFAGKQRNKRMVDTLTVGVDVVIAFWKGGSTGTAHCIMKAREAGFEPIIFLEEA